MYHILSKLANATTVSRRLGQRARVIALAFEGQDNLAISQASSLERHAVGRWRKRWQDSYDALLAIELNQSQAALERAIADVLSDAPRSGAPAKFSAEQVVQLVSIACESPRSSGHPFAAWTGRELAQEMRRRSIVSTISVSRVNQLLRSVDLQPHKRKYWCFTTEKDRPLFDSQVQAVCQTYLQAWSVFDQDGTHTVCTDEMTSLGANQRRAQPRLPRPGQPGKQECQYTRHGTLSLTGSWHVVLGQMIHTTVSPSRNCQDFADHIEQTIQTDPDGRWVFVLDNLNTHSGEAVVRRIAKFIGIEQDALGDRKKRRGILGSTKSRRQFLCDPVHRIRFVFLPKHSSWLNQIEVVFRVISQRVMRYGSFTSTEDLKAQLLEFIEYYNRTFAKPFNWTYIGRPSQKNRLQRPRTWREKTPPTRIQQILALVA